MGGRERNRRERKVVKDMLGIEARKRVGGLERKS